MGRKPEGQKTIFYELLTSEQLSPEDKSVERLEAEGVSVVTAGWVPKYGKMFPMWFRVWI